MRMSKQDTESTYCPVARTWKQETELLENGTRVLLNKSHFVTYDFKTQYLQCYQDMVKFKLQTT